MTQVVHVLAGRFESVEEAKRYMEPQWEREPGDDVSDEQYAEWEARNPTWALCDGPSSYAYLEGLLVDGSQIQSIRERAPADANILVLIFHHALGGFPARVGSTARLAYCGEWICSL